MPLPTILEQSTQPSDGGNRPADDSGQYFSLSLWTTSGLDYGYTASASEVFRALLVEANWRYDRIGGADHGEFVVEGGVDDLDAAIQSQHEVRIERAGVIWYKARITRYDHFTTETGEIRTRIWTEGYLTKLAEIRVNRTIAAGQTIAQAVTTIYDGDIKPNSRIRLVAGSIVGAYTLVGTLVFDCNALQALRTLALIQGSAEWGVAESAQLFFHQQSGATSDTGQVISAQSSRLSESGSFQKAYNRITAYGASYATVTRNNTAAQASYGIRVAKVHFPWISNTNDLTVLADNLCVAEKDGHGRTYARVTNPSARLETARVDPASPVATQGKFRFMGPDGGEFTDHYSRTAYSYAKGSPTRFYADVWAGPPDEEIGREFARLWQRLDALFYASSTAGGGGSHAFLSATHTDTVAASPVLGDLIYANSTPAWTKIAGNTTTTRKFLRQVGDGTISAAPVWDTLVAGDIPAGGSTHALLSATHTDTLAASVVQGDIIVGNATPQWSRLAIGLGGKVLRSTGTTVQYSSFTNPDTFTANAVVYASAANVLGELLTTANFVLATNGSGVPAFTNDLPTGVTIGGGYIYRGGGNDVAIADGGTAESTAVAAFNALAPTTTKGDLITRDGTNNVSLGVGVDGYVLTAASGQPTGLLWTGALSLVSVDVSGVYKVGATQVVSSQGAAVADASGGATVDAEARTAINTLLARLRTHGMIAT